MHRDPESHKGQNGKVLVIGGNDHFHGAPILCALGAEHAGADLVFQFLPPSHIDAAKTYSLNLILHAFEKEHLSPKDVKEILKFSENADAVVIGPGLGNAAETVKAVKELLSNLEKPTIVDASALVYTNTLPKVTVLTPHRGEFKNMTGDDPTPENVQKWATSLNATIICKGPKDIIANEDELQISETGNAMMTVGGTGDVLSGCIGALIAQGHKPTEACYLAAHAMGAAADALGTRQDSIRALDLVELLPQMLHKEEE